MRIRTRSSVAGLLTQVRVIFRGRCRVRYSYPRGVGVPRLGRPCHLHALLFVSQGPVTDIAGRRESRFGGRLLSRKILTRRGFAPSSPRGRVRLCRGNHQDLDVRGMRGDEALNAVQYFIDDAILVGMPMRIGESAERTVFVSTKGGRRHCASPFSSYCWKRKSL